MRYSLSVRYAGRSIEIATAAWRLESRAPVLIRLIRRGITARGPEYQKAEIPAGFFRGLIPNPRRTLRPFPIAVRLEARQNLSRKL